MCMHSLHILDHDIVWLVSLEIDGTIEGII